MFYMRYKYVFFQQTKYDMKAFVLQPTSVHVFNVRGMYFKKKKNFIHIRKVLQCPWVGLSCWQKKDLTGNFDST